MSSPPDPLQGSPSEDKPCPHRVCDQIVSASVLNELLPRIPRHTRNASNMKGTRQGGGSRNQQERNQADKERNLEKTETGKKQKTKSIANIL